MIGFKPIEDFTFDDCVKSIDRYKAEGTSADEELLLRYNSLLEPLKAEEKRDYFSANPDGGSDVKKIEALECFIKKYSHLEGATKYKPQYLAKAKQELAVLKKQLRIKKNQSCSFDCDPIMRFDRRIFYWI